MKYSAALRRPSDGETSMNDFDNEILPTDPDEGEEITERVAGRETYEWVRSLVGAVLVITLLFTFVVRLMRVGGHSMVPTLQDGDRLVLISAVHTYAGGDVVVVDRYTKEPLIKRVIAVAGDTIDIRSDYTVMINGQILQEPYIQGNTVLRDFSGPITVPDGYLFVMGDNRSVSLDSRSAEVGLVSVKDVVGVARLRIWPLKRFGAVGQEQ